MILNRSTSTIRTEPAKRTPNGGLIREAIVWGSDISFTRDGLLKEWNKKKRNTPAAVMLTKALRESSLKPFISRYEVGQVKTNPSWKWKDEFSSTSYGLFQLMGFHLTGKWAIKDKNNVYGEYTVARQLDHFDEFMYNIIRRAKTLFPTASTEKQIFHAFAGYGGNYNPDADSSVHFLANENLKTYKQLKNISGANSSGGGISPVGVGLVAIGAYTVYWGYKHFFSSTSESV